MTDPTPTPPPELRVHEDLASFAQAAEPGMLRSEAAHCLQLGLLSDMRAGRIEDRYLATVDRGGEPLLAVIRTPPYRLILSERLAELVGERLAAPEGTRPAGPNGEPADEPGNGPEGEADDALLEPLLAVLPGDLPGVVGPVALSRAFAEAYAERHGLRAQLTMSERIHACHEVVPPAHVAGRMIRAGAEHTDLLVSWWRAFAAEAVPHEPDRAEQSVARDLAATTGGLWLWEVSGRPVSLAGARGPTLSGIRIGPVYTPPAERNNGYAAALVGGLTQLLLSEGRKFVTLFTDLANPTANALYGRLGYRGVSDRSAYDFTT